MNTENNDCKMIKTAIEKMPQEQSIKRVKWERQRGQSMRLGRGEKKIPDCIKG